MKKGGGGGGGMMAQMGMMQVAEESKGEQSDNEAEEAVAIIGSVSKSMPVTKPPVQKGKKVVKTAFAGGKKKKGRMTDEYVAAMGKKGKKYDFGGGGEEE